MHRLDRHRHRLVGGAQDARGASVRPDAPVEIGVAVMWRVVDTAKAVFDVDNYKEYLSLQADTAVRSVAKVYPYDIAPNVDTTGDGEADDA